MYHHPIQFQQEKDGITLYMYNFTIKIYIFLFLFEISRPTLPTLQRVGCRENSKVLTSV